MMLYVRLAKSISIVLARCAVSRSFVQILRHFEMPLERWFRALRVSRVVVGPSEIHRYLIARELLGAAATGRTR